MKKHTHVFIRQDCLEVDAVGILTIIDEDHQPERLASEAMSALKKAITRWVANTFEGAAAYEASSEDYNIGDFVDDFRRPSLAPYLARFNIHSVELMTACPNSTHTYDSHLVDDDELH